METRTNKITPEHRQDILDMIKEYVKWLEKNPGKWNEEICIKAYWPLVGELILERWKHISIGE